MTLMEAVRTIRTFCRNTTCKNCIFCETAIIEGEKLYACAFAAIPDEWTFSVVEPNAYDVVERHENCTVEVLKDSVTGETSVGWWINKEAEE